MLEKKEHNNHYVSCKVDLGKKRTTTILFFMKLILKKQITENYLFLQLDVGEKKNNNHYVFCKVDVGKKRTTTITFFIT